VRTITYQFHETPKLFFFSRVSICKSWKSNPSLCYYSLILTKGPNTICIICITLSRMNVIFNANSNVKYIPKSLWPLKWNVKNEVWFLINILSTIQALKTRDFYIIICILSVILHIQVRARENNCCLLK
jgi:hypothetical protein